MAFTGGWKGSAMVQRDAGAVHIADKSHMESGTIDNSPTAVYHLPPTYDPGPVGEYVGMEYVISHDGTVIDTTNQRSHERDTADHGAAIAGVYGAAPVHQAGHTYTTDRFESPGAPMINVAALMRGRNGLPENNPDGFRQGVDENHFENRKFPIGERVHESRIIFPDLMEQNYSDAGPIGGAYPIPYAAQARNITDVNMTPQDRRPPPPMYGDLPTDGSPFYPSVLTYDGVIG